MNLRVKDRERLRGVQRSMIRKMMGFRQGDGEGLPHFVARTEKAISEAIAKYTRPWDEMVDRRVYGLAGHMARLAAREPGRASVWAFEYRNYKWMVGQSDSKGNQGHSRYLHTWRWEKPIYKYWRVVHRTKPGEWHEKASDVRGWNECLENFIEWRKVNR